MYVMRAVYAPHSARQQGARVIPSGAQRSRGISRVRPATIGNFPLLPALGAPPPAGAGPSTLPAGAVRRHRPAYAALPRPRKGRVSRIRESTSIDSYVDHYVLPLVKGCSTS